MNTEILKLLETDSKLSVKDIADMLGLDEAAVAADIKAMEDKKVICGYHTMIDWDKVAEEKVTALIEIKVTPQRGQGFDKIAERIYNFEEVSAVYLMAGAFDFTVILQGKTLKEVSMFVSNKLAVMETVVSTSTNFVLKKYKDHGIIFDVEKKDERLAIVP
ncbi:MAG: Lrp/AsnC family transcriptional regulator [Lachnospiraceae bacterium]|nr:Lrp/AsnC family transcriptional regulator [Lachnospiraceae bacterium]MBQ9607924.1 Lrp/AsnC family transcriptional regulator [Lachnospiraceae bacterium]